MEHKKVKEIEKYVEAINKGYSLCYLTKFLWYYGKGSQQQRHSQGFLFDFY
jgi:hypothetical protein